MLANDMCIQRPDETVSLYKMSSHKPSQKNPVRASLLFSSVKRMNFEGLNNLNNLGVEIFDIKLYNFFIHLKVDVKEPNIDYIKKFL